MTTRIVCIYSAALAICLSAAACTPGMAQEVPPNDDPIDVEQPPMEGSGDASIDPDGYAIHEWGVLRYLVHNGFADVSTSGWDYRVVPPEPYYWDPGDITVEKPIIYLHPGEDWDPDTLIDLTVSMTQGTLREVWPTQFPGGHPTGSSSYTWDDVRINSGVSCGPTSGFVPDLSSPACTALVDGGVCEAAEMSAYMHSVPHCLTSWGYMTPALLYNGYDYTPQPVTLANLPDMTVNLTNATGHAIGPLFYRLPSAPVGEVHIVVIPSIAPHATVNTGAYTPRLLDALSQQIQVQADIRATLIDMGLTENETDHFINAWNPDLLSSTLPWMAFGFLSQEAVDAMYPLTANPAPSDVVRALAFTVE